VRKEKVDENNTMATKPPLLELATVPNWWFSSGFGFELIWNHCHRFDPIQNPNCTKPTFFWPVPHRRKLRTLAAIKYLSCDRITIWYICKRCSFRCSYTSHSPIGDPITILWVALKNDKLSALFHSNSRNSDQIANRRMGGAIASKTASCTYISYCDTITTRILNWSHSSEFAIMRLCCMINLAKTLRVYVWSG